MSLLYGQLDEMDSSLDNLQAEVTDIAENDELWTTDDQQVTCRHLVAFIRNQCFSSLTLLLGGRKGIRRVKTG